MNPDHKIAFPTENMDSQLVDVIKSCLTRDVKTRPSIDQLLQHSYVKGNQNNTYMIELFLDYY